MTETKLIEDFRAARRAATPIVAISCLDPEACVQGLQRMLGEKVPQVEWDVIRGWRPRNAAGGEAVKEALQHAGIPVEDLVGPVTQLEAAVVLPDDTVLYTHNAGLQLRPDKTTAMYVQAVWNLRDTFKKGGRCLVLLGTQVSLPPELQQDVLKLDEALPTREWLIEMVEEIAAANEIQVGELQLLAAADALTGLAAFPAEQAVSMSFSRDGLDVERLWDRKRQLINDTPGLSVWRDGQTFNDLGGLEAIKARFKRIIGGRKPPRVVVFIDEIEKAMAGSSAESGDTSGTAQDQLGKMLSEMQDKEYSGALLVGVPGAAKSAFAKAVANEAGVLTIRFDLGEMKGQFVGLSEERIRHAMKVVEAVGGHGGAFFIATSNDIRAVKPELKRRFKKGIWFFDTPDSKERDVIWNIHLTKLFGTEAQKMMKARPVDEGWTGAEIETCCQTAWEEGVTLHEAAEGIIPVSISGRADVERLRKEADGRYSSTNHAGAYKMRALAEETKPERTGRKLNL
jgi:hypothetical protein